jgi:trans-2-enoyl-CoA reductase
MLATNFPNYKCARQTKERIIYTNTILLHETLCRTEEELRFKIDNWGHNVDVNDTFLEKWLAVNETNYNDFQDFYFIEPDRWKKLGYLNSKDFSKIMYIAENDSNFNISKTFLFFKNFGQWFKHFIKFKFLYK